MRGLSEHRGVVAASEIAFAGALDLDHAGPEIGQLPCRKRRGDGLLDRDDGDAL